MQELFKLIFVLCYTLLLARIIMGLVVQFMSMQGNAVPDILVKVYDVVFSITEPVLGPIRRMLPQTGMIDFSPLVVMVILIVIERVLIAILTR